MRGHQPQWRWLGAGAGALLALAAVVCAFTWQKLFDSAVASHMALNPHTRSYNDWKAPTVPLYMDIHLFNWTNPEDFPSMKPNFEELGPYRFREFRKHVNVSWHSNGTISYRTQRSWQFDEGSAGSLGDVITTLNVIAASAVYRSRFWGQMQQAGIALGLAMFGQRISVTKTAGEMLFEGYSDGLLDLAKSLPATMTGGAPPIDKFGWFYGRNNSIDTDGYVEVTNGNTNGLPGQIVRWNHLDSLPYYEGECSKLKGSAGEFIRRDLTEDDRLTMFIPDLCRTVNMEYVDSGELEGLPYHKYAMLENTFDYSPDTDENSCFCNGPCLWRGVMNVSACRFGSPSFLTLPHFLHADPELSEHVVGMRPNPEEHSFYFMVMQKMGVPIDVAGRFQFNVYLEPSPNFVLFKDVPRMLFPVFWVEQKVTVTMDVMDELRMARHISDWGGTFCACAAIILAVAVAMLACCTNKPKYTKPADLLANGEKPKDEAELKLNPI